MSSLKHILSYKHGNGRAQRYKRHGERRGTRGKPRPKANRTAASLRRSWRQIQRGEVRPVSELWEGIDYDDLLKMAVAFGVSEGGIRAGLENVVKWGREDRLVFDLGGKGG